VRAWCSKADTTSSELVRICTPHADPNYERRLFGPALLASFACVGGGLLDPERLGTTRVCTSVSM
jgi:hypothetical protein